MRNQRGRLAIRIVAGGYIIYLAIRLLQGIANGEVSGGDIVVSAIAGAAFLIVGAVIIYFSLKDLKNVKEEERKEQEELRKEEAEAAAAGITENAPEIGEDSDGDETVDSDTKDDGPEEDDREADTGDGSDEEDSGGDETEITDSEAEDQDESKGGEDTGEKKPDKRTAG